MKKTLSSVLALMLALMLALSCMSFAAAEDAAAPVPEAFLMYANGDWSAQYFGGEAPEGITATNVQITGPGAYTVGLEFANEVADLAFAAIGIQGGEQLLPGYTIELNEIRVNGEAIELGKGYTSSDDGVMTRMNLL